MLEEPKKQQNVFKSKLNEILRGKYKTEEQKSALKMLNVFKKHERLLLNYLIIILQLCLRLNTKQFMEKKFQICQHA